MRSLTVLAGERGAGKTTAARRLFDRLEAEGKKPRACLEMNERDSSGAPLDIWLHILPGETRRRLAIRPSRHQAFHFEQECFSWAREHLDQDGGAGSVPLIIDEIGPLEVLEGGGFFPFLVDVLSRDKATIIITLRTSLAETLDSRLASLGFRAEKPCRYPMTFAIFHCQADIEDV